MTAKPYSTPVEKLANCRNHPHTIQRLQRNNYFMQTHQRDIKEMNAKQWTSLHSEGRQLQKSPNHKDMNICRASQVLIFSQLRRQPITEIAQLQQNECLLQSRQRN